LTLVGRDGRAVEIAAERLHRGGFVTQTLVRPGEFALPDGLRLNLVVDGKPIGAIAPFERSNVIWAQDPGKTDSWRKIGLPAIPAANPIAFGGGVFIAGRDSRAYLIDPITAGPRAEPFVPKFEREHPGSWLAPVRIDNDSVVLADDVGRVLRVALRRTPVARLIGEAQVVLDQRIVSNPASTGNAVIVVTADRRVRALAARDLSPVGSWSLDAPPVGSPVGIGSNCFVMDRGGGVMALGRDGQRLWSIQLGAEVVGDPAVWDQSVAFLTRDGMLHRRDVSSGHERQRIALGTLPSGGLVVASDRMLVPVGHGTIRPVLAQPTGENRP
jgi:hypothetical protein